MGLICWVVPALAADADKPVELKWSGDLRLRGVTEKNGDIEARPREQIRVRLAVAAKISSQLKAEIRLATARSNRSTNQTLGDGSDGGSKRRFVGLDLGYAEWTPLSFFKFWLGRIPQTHYRPGSSQILLDEDMNLEGAATALEHNVLENLKATLSFGSALLRENYDTFYNEDLSDNTLNWGQLALNWEMSSKWKTVIGTGFFNYTSLQGKNFADMVSGGVPNGNSELAAGQIKVPFLARQYFSEVFYKTGESSTLSVFAEYVDNHETADFGSAFWLGAGFAAKKWDTQVAYGEVEADAVPSMYTNSDFASGQTDSRGWVVAGRWKAKQGISLKLTEFINRLDMKDNNKQYLRTQLDLIANF